MSERAQGILDEPRRLSDLEEDATGQLATEWLLVTAFIVMPMIMLIPVVIGMIKLYFYRTAEIIRLPFP